MTPLAHRVAKELTLPKRERTYIDAGGILPLIGQDMHCFEVSALVKSVSEAMEADNMWPEIETMLPATFLPSPVTWLEYLLDGSRIAYVVQEVLGGFDLRFVSNSEGETFSFRLCNFRAETAVNSIGRIHIEYPAESSAAPRLPEITEKLLPMGKLAVDTDQARFRGMSQSKRALYSEYIRAEHNRLNSSVLSLDMELNMLRDQRKTLPMIRTFIGQTILILDLINTPGLVGLKQRDPHRALSRQFQGLGSGRFPLRSWSEVVVKTHTETAKLGEQMSGGTFHKCLHFVRSHQRRYQSGHVAIIPAHWRGDPALGIKRTRYRVAA